MRIINEVSEADVRARFRRITLALIKKRCTITTMESCTCGQIASLITDTEGASAVLKGAFITYSNEAKIRSGVDPEIIREYGVYSADTARAMAAAAKTAFGADIAIGITGTMGNTDPANEDSVPGIVYVAVAYGAEAGILEETLQIALMKSRYEYKLAAAGAAADLLERILPLQL